MKLVLLCNDYWHPGDVAEKGFEPVWQKLGADVRVIYDAKEFDAKILKDTDVLVLAKLDTTTRTDETPWVSDSIISEFEAYIANGGGFIGIHSGTCYDNNPRMKAFLGGAFVSHPDECPVRFDPIARHPITQGVEPFSAVDEHYQVDVLEGVLIVGATSSVHSAQAGAWVKELGKGRIAVITMGHNIGMYEQPGMQTLLINTVNFVAKK